MFKNIPESLISSALRVVLSEASESQYWSAFERYIFDKRNYVIDPNGTDTFGYPLDRNDRLVRDQSGNRVFRISRMIEKDTFLMDQLIVRDEQGNTIRGLGILDFVYTFEKDFLLKHNFERIIVDPVNRIVKRKLKQYYGEFEWEPMENATIIHLKRP